ncbi:MAG: hypothetical protein Tsb0034_08210 [Ekhidna sp.]
MKKLFTESLIEIVCRIYVFAFLNVYGLGKIFGGQFFLKGKLPTDVAVKTLDEASAFEIAWTFMGYSRVYIFFIGFLQVVGAWFLLFRRTKLFGVLILIPILANILVFNIVFLDGKGPIANASIYFLMLIYILYHNRETVIPAVTSFFNPPSQIRLRDLRLKRILLIVLILAVIFVIDQLLVNLLGYDQRNSG